MTNSDDEDAFLYGSGDEAPAPKRQKTEQPANEDEDLYKEENEEKAEPQEEEGSDDEEESSDDDIEFVIEDSAPKVTNASSTTTQAPAAEEPKVKGAESSKLPEKEEMVTKDDGAGALDINKVAEMDGKPLTQVDLDELKDKPWRIPGADILDYFNYGFDEFTWTAYCHKQDSLRGEFNPQKVLASVMGGMPPMNMPNMPNMPMQQMPMQQAPPKPAAQNSKGRRHFRGTPPPFRK